MLVTYLVRRHPLAPEGLWLDDAWTAIVHKADSFSEVWLVGVTGHGFAAALKGVFALFGFSEARAQALPFAAALATPPLLFLALRKDRVRSTSAFAGAALLVVSSTHALYSTRVKQFTSDALLTTIAIATGLWLLRDPRSSRRWWWALGISIAITALSPLLAAPCASLLVAGWWATRGSTDRSSRTALRSMAIYAVATLAWFAVTVFGHTPDALQGFWRNRYVSFDGPVEVVTSAVGLLAELMEGFLGLPSVVTLVLWLAGSVVVWRKRPPVAILLAGPVVLAWLAAFAQLAPLGGKRTDIYLYPAIAAMFGYALNEIELRRRMVAVATAIVVLLAAALAFEQPDSYPDQGVKPFVAAFEGTAPDGAGLVLEPTGSWSYLVYSDSHVDLIADDSVAMGFRATVADEDIHLLGPVRGDPETDYLPIVQAAAQRHDGELWLITAHTPATQTQVFRVMRQAGLQRLSTETSTAVTALSEWERRDG